MPRGYRRSGSARRSSRYARSVSSRSKYSVETRLNNITLSTLGTDGTSKVGTLDIVPEVAIQGMRKVKHMQITVALQHGVPGDGAPATVDITSLASLAGGCPILWAMVYVPQGQTAIQAPSTAGSIYEPNQFVIASGIADANAGPIRINTPLARNLNSGDKISFTYRILNGVTLASYDVGSSLCVMCRYAITLN